jgi:hypothetical protein
VIEPSEASRHPHPEEHVVEVLIAPAEGVLEADDQGGQARPGHDRVREAVGVATARAGAEGVAGREDGDLEAELVAFREGGERDDLPDFPVPPHQAPDGNGEQPRQEDVRDEQGVGAEDLDLDRLAVGEDHVAEDGHALHEGGRKRRSNQGAQAEDEGQHTHDVTPFL